MGNSSSPRSARWFDLPREAHDWMPSGGASYYLPSDFGPYDEAQARQRVTEWDALVGRLFRTSLFDLTAEPRELRRLAEAIAAVTEDLAVTVGDVRP
jgi:hypothetical protein